MDDTEDAEVARARVITVVIANDRIRGREGGVEATVDVGTLVGGALVSFLAEKRRKTQMDADVNRVVRNPPTRIIRILGRSEAGNAGAKGSMTRLGTKNTASQRVRNLTPGVNKAEVVLSTGADKLRKRRVDMRVRRMSIAARGAGKEIDKARSRLLTKY